MPDKATYNLRLTDPGMWPKKLENLTLDQIEREMAKARDYTRAEIFEGDQLVGSAIRWEGGDEKWQWGIKPA